MENQTVKNLAHVPAGLDAATEHTMTPEDVYSTRDALDIIADNRPEPKELWGGLEFTSGLIMEIIGASGLGKSRIVLNLAINQILGRRFADMPVYPEPLTWLFYGNENSFFRFRKDLRKMTSTLNTELKERLKGYLFLPTMEKSTDVFISFSDSGNIERLKNTMRQRKPNVLVLDPWGAIIDGDELSDGDVRRTLVTIQNILSTNPDTPCVGIVLNHSRNGLKEEIDAAGPNKANFGKNSKAIHTVVRCAWNLRRAELSEHVKKIELIHAKFSNIAPYPPVAVDFCEQDFQYRKDTTFNHAVWQATLEKAYRSHTTLTTDERKEAKEDEGAKLRQQILTYLGVEPNNGHVTRKNLGVWLNSRGIAENRIRSILSEMHCAKQIAILCDKSNNRIICLPDAALKIMDASQPNTYRVMVPPAVSKVVGTAQDLPCSTPAYS